MGIFRKLAILTAAPVAYAFAHGYGWHMMDEHYGFYNSGGVIMFIVLILLVAVGAYLLFRNKHWVCPSAYETPLQILKKRYAEGEITRKEFERIKKEIE